jgi:hypothetical protein
MFSTADKPVPVPALSQVDTGEVQVPGGPGHGIAVSVPPALWPPSGVA